VPALKPRHLADDRTLGDDHDRLGSDPSRQASAVASHLKIVWHVQRTATSLTSAFHTTSSRLGSRSPGYCAGLLIGAPRALPSRNRSRRQAVSLRDRRIRAVIASTSSSATPTPPGSADPTRTPTACCASTSPRAPTSPPSPTPSSTPSPTSSTPAPASAWTSPTPPSSSPSCCARSAAQRFLAIGTPPLTEKSAVRTGRQGKRHWGRRPTKP
jgi:hypothetical protein